MFTLREMTVDDGKAFGDLLVASPDGGAVEVSPIFHTNTFTAYQATKHDMIGVTATHPDHDGIVGSGIVSFFDATFNGQVRPCALLSALAVHPQVRRQGLAAQLAAWRIEQAKAHVGEDGIIFAAIQEGNIGSTGNAAKWSNQKLKHTVVSPVKIRQDPPASVNGYQVRSADEADYEQIAEQTNLFYRDYNMHVPYSADDMATFNAHSPVDEPVYHWTVVEDRNGTMVAGIMVIDNTLLNTARITKMPLGIKLANVFLRLIPADGHVRLVTARNLWFKPGHEAAAAYLWQHIRYDWRDRASAVRIDYDDRGPIKPLLKHSRIQPKSHITYSVLARDTIDASCLINPYS